MATLRKLKNMDYASLEERTGRFAAELSGILASKGIPAQVPSLASMFCVFFSMNPVTDFDSARKCDAAAFAAFYRQMREHGILLAPSAFETGMVSFAHSDDDFDHALSAAKKLRF